MINIYAPINLLGYGIHANNMIKAFTDKGTELNLTPIGQIQNDPYFEAYWRSAEQNRINYDSKSPSLHIFHDEFSNQASGSPLYSFSIFETSLLKNASISMLKNGPTDVILTTTQAHATLLESMNLGKTIKVVNEGIDDIIFNTIPVDKHINTEKFTFITVGKKEKRKNTSLLIKLFIDTMKENDVALIAHTFNPFSNKEKVHPFKNLASWTDVNPQDHGFEYKGWDGKAHKFTHKQCDIYLTAPGIQTAEMGCLYHSANVGIQISRGEGWDLPLTEMLACGLPTIASDCLGHSEYLNGVPSELLAVPMGKEEIAEDGIWFNGSTGNWGSIDEDAFREQLIQSYTDRNNYIIKSEAIANYMAENYSWTKATEQFTNLLT